MYEGMKGVGVRVVRVRVLQVRLPLQREAMVPKMVGQAMAALLPPGELHLAAASATAAVSRPPLTRSLTRPPALNAVEQPPAGGMVAVFDAWGETRNPSEHEQLRADLTAHVWNERGELLSPYVV